MATVKEVKLMKDGKMVTPVVLIDSVKNLDGSNYEDKLPTVFLNKIYPVGSIYTSVNNVSPASFLGGTWEAITDRFLLGAGSEYIGGSTGGSKEITLTEAQMPKHYHSGTTASAGEHTHKWYYTTDTFTGNAYYNNVKDTNTDKSKDTSSAGAHTHTFTTDSKGSNQPHDNMPPYLAVYMWKRTA